MANAGQTDLTPMWNENCEPDQPHLPAKEGDDEALKRWQKPVRESVLLVSLVSALALLSVDDGLAGVVLVFVTIPLALGTLAA